MNWFYEKFREFLLFGIIVFLSCLATAFITIYGAVA